MNIPNILTVIRIILTPVLVIFLINGRYHLAFGVFVLAGLSDALDGFVARVMNQKSKIGAILDPIADKALLASCYITLAVTGFIPNWLAVTVISRDLIIVFGVVVFFLFHSGIEIRPTVISKLTTLFQLMTIFVVLSGLISGYNIKGLQMALYVLTAFLTIISGLHYIYKGITILSVEQNNEQ